MLRGRTATGSKSTVVWAAIFTEFVPALHLQRTLMFRYLHHPPVAIGVGGAMI